MEFILNYFVNWLHWWHVFTIASVWNTIEPKPFYILRHNKAGFGPFKCGFFFQLNLLPPHSLPLQGDHLLNVLGKQNINLMKNSYLHLWIRCNVKIYPKFYFGLFWPKYPPTLYICLFYKISLFRRFSCLASTKCLNTWFGNFLS